MEMGKNYGCNCEIPKKIYSTDGCRSCWTCGICGNFGGCDNMSGKFSQDAEKIWGKPNQTYFNQTQFTVQCDSTLNTPDVVQANELRARITIQNNDLYYL